MVYPPNWAEAEVAPAPLLTWVLEHVQSGLLVLDADLRVVLANEWFLRRARLEHVCVRRKPLVELFPQCAGSHLEKALVKAVRTGLSTLLSEALHPSPLPLYALSASGAQNQRLKQSMQIIPMGIAASHAAGQRYVLLQVNDVSPAVARERLLREQADRLHTMAHVDALTRIGNRRHFDAMLAREWAHAMRQRLPLSLVMFDMDHFKRYNDVYGHQQGDDCLSTVASVVQSAAQRPRDVVCRYGGEELVMLLPETDLSGATALAEQVLQRVRALALPHLANGKSIVTLSAGVASVRPETGIHADNLLQCADRALYQAKSQGRDQVVQAAPEDCSAPQS